MILELKESADNAKAPEPKSGKGALKNTAFPKGRAGTMASVSHNKGSIIESTPQGPSEAELATGVDRKFSNEGHGPNQSGKSQGAEPLLKASSSKTN